MILYRSLLFIAITMNDKPYALTSHTVSLDGTLGIGHRVNISLSQSQVLTWLSIMLTNTPYPSD